MHLVSGLEFRVSPVAEPAAAGADRPRKIPESVLVVIHTKTGQVLLLERADHPGFWQSVTGSKDRVDELPSQTCRREVLEETGLDTGQYVLSDWAYSNQYEIYPHWRHRYPDGVTHNVEHVFGLCLPAALPVRLSAREHLQFAWLPWAEAAGRCFSWTNVEAIQRLAQREGWV